jgi:hypothetical protein
MERNGKPVLLGDVVSVVQDHQPLIGSTLLSSGQPPTSTWHNETLPSRSGWDCCWSWAS